MKVYSFDLGADFVRTKFPDKDITIRNFVLPIVETDPPQPYAEPLWKEFYKEYKEDVYSGAYKTLVIDTATALWGILRQAITEEKNRKKLLEVEYALPNTKMSTIFAHPRISGVNLITIQYLTFKYVNGENTGELILDGWKQTEGQVDVVLEIEEAKRGKDIVMRTLMKKNRFERSINGQTFDDTSYEEILALLGV